MRRRQREHDVEVGHLQQLGLARLEPLARLAALTLGAVPIAAAVVGDGRVPARRVLTTRDMPAEVCRAAGLDRAHHLELGVREVAPHGMTPSRAVIAEDVRDLQHWPGHGAAGYVASGVPAGGAPFFGVSGVSRSSGLTMSRSTLLATCA